jgi:hypothetical protein
VQIPTLIGSLEAGISLGEHQLVLDAAEVCYALLAACKDSPQTGQLRKLGLECGLLGAQVLVLLGAGLEALASLSGLTLCLRKVSNKKRVLARACVCVFAQKSHTCAMAKRNSLMSFSSFVSAAFSATFSSSISARSCVGKL